MPGRRIVLTTHGSLGDLHPLIGLGIGLASRGHKVTIATSEPYRESIIQSGLCFHPVRPHAVPEQLLRPSTNPDADTEVLIRGMLFPSIEDSYADLLEACAQADLLISHMLAFAAPLVAEKTGIDWVSVVLQPLGFLSRYDNIVTPSMSTPSGLQELDAWTSRAAWHRGRILAHAWAEPVRRFRAVLGLAPGRDPVYEDHHSPHLVLGLFSPLFGMPHPDWPPQTRITGFVVHDGTRQMAGLPPTVREFLETGPPPIVATLGSHSMFDLGNFYSQTILAAGFLGQRVVLLGAGADVYASSMCSLHPWLRPLVLACEYVPFSRIFPQALVIVHHGGIGSIGAALHAGRPMLLVPQGFDQFHNSWHATDMGFARVVANHFYTAARAACELTILLRNPRYARVAREFSRALIAEDGLGAACEAIEQQLRVRSTESRPPRRSVYAPF